MNSIKRIWDALTSLAPSVFQAEVAAGLAAVVGLFKLNIPDTERASLITAIVLAFTLVQWLTKAAEGKK